MTTECTTTSRSLTQNEIDAYNRIDFETKIIDAVRSGLEVKFLAVKNHHSLVCIKQNMPGEFQFTIGGKYFYTYKLSDLMEFIEKLYDEAQIIALHGEFEIEAVHQTANADAEE
jgi:hypothetical protein